jgi:hypothetical protein
MAKYTMLFAEYLERGGACPASFSLIQGFEEIFKKHYCDKEIGFETEALFFMKLDEKADIFMQAYADKITRLATAWTGYDSPAKVRYTQEYKKFTGGAQKATTKELPFDSENAEASLINNSDEYENNDSRATTETETGETHDEAQRAIEFLNNRVHCLIIDLLKEFKTCFMGVY